MSLISSADTERLSGLLGEELELYRQIKNLTRKQTELLTKDDIEGFNSSLDKREELIEKIKGLHRESDSLMQSYVSSSTSSSGSKNNKIEELKSDIRKELEACVELNNENSENLTEKQKDHTKKIDEQSAKRKTIGGYAQSVPNIPEMFDKKS